MKRLKKFLSVTLIASLFITTLSGFDSVEKKTKQLIKYYGNMVESYQHKRAIRKILVQQVFYMAK